MSVTTILRCRWTGTLVAGFIALSVAILAALLLPGQAEAQEQATPNTTTKLVEPGDSLWTIAQARLSPDAAPQQVAEEVGRIYALNQDQLRDNPNLLLVGQELVVSPVVGEEPLVAEQQAPKPIVAESEGVSDSPAAEGAVSADVIPSTLPTSNPTDEQAESAPAESTPAESTPTTTVVAGGIAGSLLDAYDNLKADRRLLGVGILGLTLIVALLMAWRLPMRRNVEDPAVWGIPQEYYKNYAPPEASPEAAKGPEGEPSGAASSPASGPPPKEAQREPSLSSSSPAAREAKEDVVAEGSAVAAFALGRERLRRVHHLRRISQRRSPSKT